MEFMSLTALVQYGTPALLLALIILVTVLVVVVRFLAEDVKELGKAISELKGELVWNKNCKDTHSAVNKTLEDHEERIRVLESKRRAKA